MARYRVAAALSLKHWAGEATAVARLQGAGTTHLIGVESLALIQAVSAQPQGLSLREITHALGFDGERDTEVEQSLGRIIEGLLQSGLLRQADDDAEPGTEARR